MIASLVRFLDARAPAVECPACFQDPRPLKSTHWHRSIPTLIERVGVGFARPKRFNELQPAPHAPRSHSKRFRRGSCSIQKRTGCASLRCSLGKTGSLVAREPSVRGMRKNWGSLSESADTVSETSTWSSRNHSRREGVGLHIMIANDKIRAWSGHSSRFSDQCCKASEPPDCAQKSADQSNQARERSGDTFTRCELEENRLAVE